MEEVICKSKVAHQTGTFTFEVEGFLALPDEVGDTVESPEFELCGRTWQLRIFPGGSLQAHKGFVSFYLASKSLVVTRASYKLIIVRQPQNSDDEQHTQHEELVRVRDEIFQSTGIRKFEARGVHVDGWGRDKFIAIHVLKDAAHGLLVNNRIIFKTEITAYGDLESPTFAGLSLALRKDHCLTHDIGLMLYDRYTTDIVLVITDESTGMITDRILAHRTLLCARSPVFYAMLQEREGFDSAMAETAKREVIIVDFDGQTIKDMLVYVYTEECK
jgi:hypothetical protein